MTFNELLALDEEKKGQRAVSSNRGITVSRDHDTVIPAEGVEAIGKAVAVVGKQAATHRFTRQEKEALGEIVYRYGQRGWQTSENEIVRIGINWLMADQAKRKDGSLLHRVLKALQKA